MSAPKPVLVFQTALLSDGNVRVGIEGEASEERIALLLMKAGQQALNKLQQLREQPSVQVPPPDLARQLVR